MAQAIIVVVTNIKKKSCFDVQPALFVKEKGRGQSAIYILLDWHSPSWRLVSFSNMRSRMKNRIANFYQRNSTCSLLSWHLSLSLFRVAVRTVLQLRFFFYFFFLFVVFIKRPAISYSSHMFNYKAAKAYNAYARFCGTPVQKQMRADTQRAYTYAFAVIFFFFLEECAL